MGTVGGVETALQYWSIALDYATAALLTGLACVVAIPRYATSCTVPS